MSELITIVIIYSGVFIFIILLAIFFPKMMRRQFPSQSQRTPGEIETAQVEENKKKGIFGPTKLGKQGRALFLIILIALLNIIIIKAPYNQLWLIVAMDLFYVTVFMPGFFTENVYIKNGDLIYRPSLFKKREAHVSRIQQIQKTYQSGYRGMPNPIFTLDVIGQKDIQIFVGNWKPLEITEFIKYLKAANPNLIIDPAFGALVAATNTDEFEKAKKAYEHNENAGVIKFGLVSLGLMAFFYIIWFLANHSH